MPVLLTFMILASVRYTLSPGVVVREVDDHVVALSDVHSNCARNLNRGSHDGVAVACICARIDRNRMLEEIGVSGDHSHRFNIARRAEEPKVPLGRCRSGRENAEPVLSVPDSHPRLNRSVDDPLVATGRIDHFISALRIQGTEPLLGKDQRNVSDAVVSRQS